MTTPDDPERDAEEADVDLDLDAEDEVLRKEAVGEPTTIRINGKVITFPHQKDWPHEASIFLNNGNSIAWAQRALTAADFKKFSDAKVRNYQLERIIEVVSANGGITPGKPPRRSRSSRSTRPR